MKTLRPVFIVGCGRSGTTLLGSLLGGHSRCVATPESQFLFSVFLTLPQPWGRESQAAALRGFASHWRFQTWNTSLPENGYPDERVNSFEDLVLEVVRDYATSVQKGDAEVWIDHTGTHLAFAMLIVDLFPAAKFIHLVRDGRAVVASIRKLDWGLHDIHRGSQWWASQVGNGLAAEQLLGDRLIRVRYEDLVAEPEKTLRSISAFLELDWEPEILSGSGFDLPTYTETQHRLIGGEPEPSRISAWKEELSAREVEVLESVAGNLLPCLGYPTVYGHRARRATKPEKLAWVLKDMVFQRPRDLVKRSCRRLPLFRRARLGDRS